MASCSTGNTDAAAAVQTMKVLQGYMRKPRIPPYRRKARI